MFTDDSENLLQSMNPITPLTLLQLALLGVLWLGATVANASPATAPDKNLGRDVAQFLETYNRLYQGFYAVAQEADWKASTDVTDEHTGQRIGADQAQAVFVGNPWVIEKARALLQQTNSLDEVTIRQLRMIWLHAAGSPGTIPEVVTARVTAEAHQSATLDSFPFKWQRPGSTTTEPITANQIDDILQSSTNLAERLAVWTASKESGVALRPGLIELRDLRNRVAREMSFNSFYALQVANFGMTVPEMKALTEQLVRDTRPLYEQLHCWARHTLAERFHQPVPTLIPAHWLGNRWSQEWPGLVESVDLDPLFKGRQPEWIVKQAVAYGESLGLPSFPASFWVKSDLYELPADAKRKKNTHASAWDINLQGDVRSLENVKPDFYWFGTAHHEMGHVFYMLSYNRPEIPIVLREGASPAFHEAMAETLATPTIQLPYLRQVGVVPADMKFNETQWLLNSALNQIVFMPWSAGVMASWERDFYESDLSTNELNKRWWQYVAQYQGIEAPTPRGEEFCDAATKTHINDNPALYYQYAIAFAIKYHLHMYIANKLLHQDPRNCNFYGNKEVGAFLYKLMKVGATRDWRQLIREATGEELSAKAMLDYYAPLMKYLEEQNQGRKVGW
jgi:peptidyl-dipeptidase A